MVPINKLVMIVILLQAILMVFVNQMIYMSNTIEHIKIFLPYVNLLVLFLAAVVLISIKEIGKTIEKNAQIHAMKENLKQTESLINTLQSQRHEYNRHLQSLQAMIHLGEIDIAKEYIDGLSENKVYTDDMVYVGNPFLTALLNSTYRVAESKNIKFDFAIKCDMSEIPMSPWDLLSVLGNLLDNAFEAVVGEEEKNREIGLEIKYENREYVIYVYNKGPTIPPKMAKKIFERGYTTKGSQGRGYGLFLIKNILKQYGGRIELKSDKRTLFIVHIPLKGE